MTAREDGFTLVELLVVMALLGVLLTAIMNVVVSTTRASTFTQDMRTVMDDGRLSLDRIRKELRSARRVLETGSTASSIRFWVDANQDGEMTVDELVCYATAPLAGGGFELLRWTGAEDDCALPESGAQTVARTLVQSGGIFEYEPAPSADPAAPRTRLVHVRLVLDVRTSAGPDQLVSETTVRLRNVE